MWSSERTATVEHRDGRLGPLRPGRPLRIGLMLRGVDEYDGAGVYIRKLVDALLEFDPWNEYVLFYADDPPGRGRYARPAQRARGGRPRAGQAAVGPGRGAAWRRGGWGSTCCSTTSSASRSVGVLPDRSCSSAARSTGPFPEYYPTLGDRVESTVQQVLSIPLFCRRAERVLTNCEQPGVTSFVSCSPGCHAEKMATIYAAADERFTRITDPAVARAACGLQLPASPTSRSFSWS